VNVTTRAPLKVERAIAAGVVALLLSATSARAGTVWVALPDASVCGFDALAAALKARLPGADVQQHGVAPDGAVRLELERRQDGWSLTLTAPAENALKREAFADRDDCVAVFEAAALITDRYLSGIQWNAGAVEVSPLPPAVPAPPLQLMLALGGGAALGMTGITGQGELDIGIAKGAWLLSLDAAFLGLGQKTLTTTPATVTLSQQTGGAQLAAGGRVAGFSAELLVGAELYWVASSTNATAYPHPLLGASQVTVPLPFVGARVGYALALTSRLSLGIRVSARAHLETHTFEVEGYSGALVSHVLDGDAAVFLSFVFF
jgi:hypothetical protein